jgi:uncharacterized protein YwbE
MSKDHCSRQNFFPGLLVKIISTEGHVIGKVYEILTKISYDPHGIFVKLETGESGNAIEIIQTDSEKIYNKLIADFLFDLEHDETLLVEFKETFAYPVDPEIPLDEVTKEHKKLCRKLICKAIASLANAYGGTLYIGIQDKTKIIMGLERDYKLLDVGDQDSDGLNKKMKSYIPSLFKRGTKIYEAVHINFIKYENKDICVIKVDPFKFPLVLTYENKEYFYVRQNDSSNPYPDLNSFLDYWTEHIKRNTTF